MRGALLFLLAATLPAVAESGHVFVYAQELTEARKWLLVSCQGEPAAEVKAGRVFALELQPGRYVLAVERGVPATVEVQSGRAEFVRVDWNFGTTGAPTPILRLVPPGAGQEQSRPLFYIESKRVRSVSVLKQDPRGPMPQQLKTRTPQR